jgi:hypothetical protein
VTNCALVIRGRTILTTTTAGFFEVIIRDESLIDRRHDYVNKRARGNREIKKKSRHTAAAAATAHNVKLLSRLFLFTIKFRQPVALPPFTLSNCRGKRISLTNFCIKTKEAEQ